MSAIEDILLDNFSQEELLDIIYNNIPKHKLAELIDTCYTRLELFDVLKEEYGLFRVGRIVLKENIDSTEDGR